MQDDEGTQRYVRDIGDFDNLTTLRIHDEAFMYIDIAVYCSPHRSFQLIVIEIGSFGAWASIKSLLFKFMEETKPMPLNHV